MLKEFIGWFVSKESRGTIEFPLGFIQIGIQKRFVSITLAVGFVIFSGK